MNINKILTSYLISFLTLLMILIVFYKHIVEIPDQKEKIRHIHQKELEILSNIYKSEIKSIEKVKDYAIWDDTYNFIKDENKNYFSDNFYEDNFKYLEIDSVIILNSDGKIKTIKNNKNIKEIKKEKLNLSEIIENKEEHFNGYIKVNDSKYAYSSHDIKKSDNTGDYVGEIIFLKEINENLIEKISKKSLLKIKEKKYIEKDKLYHHLSIPLIEDKIKLKKERAIYDWSGNIIMLFEIEHDYKEIPKVLTGNMLISMCLIVIIVLLMNYIINKKIVKPMQELSKKLKEMNNEEKIEKIEKKTNIVEYDNVILKFNQLVENIQEKNMELKKISYLDELTKVKNKRYFNENIQKIINEAAKEEKYIGMLVSDIDYFKKYNDTLGHVEGDFALKEFANVLMESVKNKEAHVVRYGGEEFVIILKSEKREDFKNTAKEIKNILEEKKIIHPNSKISSYITTSTGGVFLKVSENTKIKPNDLVRLADSYLYKIKEKSRNEYYIKEIKIESMIEEVKE